MERLNSLDAPSPPAVFTEAEVARLMRVSKFTLERMRKAGRIKFVLVGKRVRYTQQHIDEFLGKTPT